MVLLKHVNGDSKLSLCFASPLAVATAAQGANAVLQPSFCARQSQIQYHDHSTALQNRVGTIIQELSELDPSFADLVAGLLQYDAAKRPTASEALQHAWFRDLYPSLVDPAQRTILDVQRAPPAGRRNKLVNCQVGKHMTFKRHPKPAKVLKMPSCAPACQPEHTHTLLLTLSIQCYYFISNYRRHALQHEIAKAQEEIEACSASNG
jgi:serine/threonine protein kinase